MEITVIATATASMATTHRIKYQNKSQWMSGHCYSPIFHYINAKIQREKQWNPLCLFIFIAYTLNTHTHTMQIQHVRQSVCMMFANFKRTKTRKRKVFACNDVATELNLNERKQRYFYGNRERTHSQIVHSCVRLRVHVEIVFIWNSSEIEIKTMN